MDNQEPEDGNNEEDREEEPVVHVRERSVKVTIVGAGVGGLATAIRLQRGGHDVTVLEKNETVGGRANTLDAEGYHFDTGPTLLLMPDVYAELFAAGGADLGDYVTMRRMKPNYRIRFDDGLCLDVTPDLDELKASLEAIEPGAAAGLEAYLRQAEVNYRVSRERFVERNFLSFGQFATPANLGYLMQTKALRNLFKEAGRHFKDDRLRLAFTFQTMYLGGPPTEALAIYSLLPYTELAEGIWYPEGGVYSLIGGMATLARELGAEILTDCEVARIAVAGRRASGVELNDGRFIAADVVVSNVDLPTTYLNLLPDEVGRPYTAEKLAAMKYTASAFMLYLGVNGREESLAHHNVLFASNWRENFAGIFGRRRRLPGVPSLYVNASARTDSTVAPPGKDAIYVLVPVSNLDAETDWRTEAKAFRDVVVERLERYLIPGLSSRIEFEEMRTPLDWQDDYGLARGAAFGLAHGFRQVGYFRPQNKVRDLDNVYFVGASTVPGTGVPMVILGSRLVSERILNDWGESVASRDRRELSGVP